MKKCARYTLGFLLMLALPLPASGQDQSPPAGEQAETLRVAKLMVVGDDNGGVVREFFGQVVARQTVDMAFQVAGQIVDLPVEEGARIEEGDLISRLDLEPFELQLEQAQLQADQAQRAYDRASQLTLSASPAAVEDAQTNAALADVALRNARVALENAELHAPFDALVARRYVANFSTVSPGTPVVRIHDMSELQIEIDVPEVLFQRAGQRADVTFLARFPTGAQTYPLEIREFTAEASTVGQTYKLTLAMEQTASVVALPGSSVTVIATLNDNKDALIVPGTAIRIGNDGSTSVLVFSPTGADEGRIEEVEVEIEPTRDGQFDVVAGLEPGTEIVRVGAQALSDGASVRRFTGFSN